MKKLLFGLAMVIGTLSFAQYPNNGWGNNNGYEYYDDEYYFPEDYYYDYPADYYADNYYQSYYNDYRNSIMLVNWNDFFRSYRLSRLQIQQIMMLNDMYPSFSSWNSYYRYNPDRWYYDRFYTLRQILGPQIFIVFQNNYYRGYDPIVYFQNYRRDYYAPRYRVTPRYTNVNINIFKIDRNRFYEKHGNKFGWNQTRNPHNQGGFRNDSGTRTLTSASGVRTNNSVLNTNGLRNENSPSGVRNTKTVRNSVPATGGVRNPGSGSGVRSNATSETVRPQNGIRPVQSSPSRAVQNQPQTNGGGFRNGSNAVRSTQNSSTRDGASASGTRVFR